MKTSPACPTKDRAFTRTDLAVVVGLVGFLAMLFVRAQEDPVAALAAAKAKQQRLKCISNLKQIGLGFRIWSNDNKDLFPMRTKAKESGSMEAIESGETFRHFLAASNELNTPKILVCPSDNRSLVADWGQLTGTNLSYFVAVDADEAKPQMLLSGDRNLTNGLALKKNLLTVSPDPPAGWTAAIHVEAGNLGLSDGSALQANTAMLRRQIEAHKDADKPIPQRLQFPE
jgi:hypothetical protein